MSISSSGRAQWHERCHIYIQNGLFLLRPPPPWSVSPSTSNTRPSRRCSSCFPPRTRATELSEGSLFFQRLDFLHLPLAVCTTRSPRSDVRQSDVVIGARPLRRLPWRDPRVIGGPPPGQIISNIGYQSSGERLWSCCQLCSLQDESWQKAHVSEWRGHFLQHSWDSCHFSFTLFLVELWTQLRGLRVAGKGFFFNL